LVSVSAHDVAAILRSRLSSPGVVQVHKLLYYVQGWHLAWTGEPAFDERIEAWANGPVVADLWRAEKRGMPAPPRSAPTDDLLATIDYVLDRYGSMTGVALVRQTHVEDPWKDVSESEAAFALGNSEIRLEALRSWFERDDERLRFLREVSRLRSLEGNLQPRPPSPFEDEALQRALTGRRVPSVDRR
jgi:uncharacterized phage-associated protein